jgi:hypothetical protein
MKREKLTTRASLPQARKNDISFFRGALENLMGGNMLQRKWLQLSH